MLFTSVNTTAHVARDIVGFIPFNSKLNMKETQENDDISIMFVQEMLMTTYVARLIRRKFPVEKLDYSQDRYQN